MALRFIAVDDKSGANNSPTIWVDNTTGDLIMQGWDADAPLLDAVEHSPAPGHVPGVPAGESVIRIPAHMRDAVREACDVADTL